ncbi:uncharacterized protein LOC116342487 [Contarinia nasturtii]|uniref:uncharacterized protein LOC116342487 n=1 Tax=Contarinia nasturtii TaxID=265458 RepID=UPI0012D3BD91|nr:uncharacterized protein LOC116342487 [Contarinia nasturtii]XP_031625985.1 uncharacterized protein LOC116342487 [Contarinia nasturtii]XP_031625986.1 uncharacterized protein LOC116342487 [Contarinia nasturtii]
MLETLTSIKATCGNLLHSLWKVQKAPESIEPDAMNEILGCLKSLQNCEKELLTELHLKDSRLFAVISEEFRQQHVMNDMGIKPSENRVDSTKSIHENNVQMTSTLNGTIDHKITPNEKTANITKMVCESNSQMVDEKPNGSLQVQELHLSDSTVDLNVQSANENVESDDNLIVDHNESYYLLLHAIEHLEGKPANSVVTLNSTIPELTNNIADFDVQAEEFVTTTQENVEHTYARNQPMRESNHKSQLEIFNKQRRRSMDYRIMSHAISSSMDYTMEPKVKTQSGNETKTKLAKAMEKRKSATRKTICFERRSNEHDDDDEMYSLSRNFKHADYESNPKLAKAMEKRKSATRKTICIERRSNKHEDDDEMYSLSRNFKQVAKADYETKMKLAKAMKKRQSAIRKTICIPRIKVEEFDNERRNTSNTNSQMYAMNKMFHELCIFCDKKCKRSLVQHYVQEHPNLEIPISRPSPAIAKKLRLQPMKHTLINRKILGKCVFCEEDKSFAKSHWETHITTHTGEHMFACSKCNNMVKIKGEHSKKCSGEPLNIFRLNDNHASKGFMCKDCNYLQIWRNNIIKHLKNEHGYMGPEENYHYEKFTLVPKRSDLIPLA